MDEGTFLWFRQAAADVCGIQLADSKREMVRNRLLRRVMEVANGDFAAYRHRLESEPRNGEEWRVFVNLLTTNKTDFFRESDHFDFLATRLLPSWKKEMELRMHRGQLAPLRVWCAACSTGEEAYTISMVLARSLGNEFPYEIIASDIDTSVLNVAKNGVYRRSRMEGVPVDYAQIFFTFGKGEIKEWVKVRRAARQNLAFQRMNLIEGPFPWHDYFDIIFCRNVFIYFSASDVERIVCDLHRTAAPGAHFFIGQSESLQNVNHSWSYVQPSVFRKGGAL